MAVIITDDGSGYLSDECEDLGVRVAGGLDPRKSTGLWTRTAFEQTRHTDDSQHQNLGLAFRRNP